MNQATRTDSGVHAIEQIFFRAESENRSAFLPYFPIGYPDYDSSIEAILAMADAGADGFEIGMPFSDPLADGPTNQAATQTALDNGTTTQTCLDAVRELREKGVDVPLIMMGYLNPILSYGIEEFVRSAKSAGADGIIIPDIPPEEASDLIDICRTEEFALVLFLAPTSNDERIKLVSEHTSGFIYVVSLTGVTGARTELDPKVKNLIAKIRAQSDKRLVLGFGISQPEHVKMINGLVDGFIVGSAIVKSAKNGTQAVTDLVKNLRDALS